MHNCTRQCLSLRDALPIVFFYLREPSSVTKKGSMSSLLEASEPRIHIHRGVRGGKFIVLVDPKSGQVCKRYLSRLQVTKLQNKQRKRKRANLASLTRLLNSPTPSPQVKRRRIRPSEDESSDEDSDNGWGEHLLSNALETSDMDLDSATDDDTSSPIVLRRNPFGVPDLPPKKEEEAEVSIPPTSVATVLEENKTKKSRCIVQ